MGYPATVDTGALAPQMLYLPGIESFTTTGAVTAGQAFFQLYRLDAPTTLTQMRTIFSGSPTGNCDMGIYDATGTNGQPNNLQGHTGAQAAATGAFTKSLTANLSLSPGYYWLAFLDTVADTLFTRSLNASGLSALYKTTATGLTVLPSLAGTVADTPFSIAMSALVSGGYS